MAEDDTDLVVLPTNYKIVMNIYCDEALKMVNVILRCNSEAEHRPPL